MFCNFDCDFILDCTYRARVCPFESRIGTDGRSPSPFSGCVTSTSLPIADCTIQNRYYSCNCDTFSFDRAKLSNLFYNFFFLIFSIYSFPRLAVVLLLVVSCWLLWRYMHYEAALSTYRFVARRSGCVDDLFHNIVISTESLFLRCSTAGKESGSHGVMKNGRRPCLWLYSNGQ